jgi:hypothetical protein
MTEARQNGPEATAAELRERFPGWRIWYTPRATVRGAWWSAQPARFPIVTDDPDELAGLIEADPDGPAASRAARVAARPPARRPRRRTGGSRP